MMKAVVVRRIGSFEYEDVEKPSAREQEVLVGVTVAGLCRTDLKIIEVGHRDLTLPRIPAEEVVGTVSALGAGVDASWLGKRVYIYPGTSCGECEACLHDAGNLCASMQIMGFHRDGGFAEYVTAPSASLIAIPDHLESEHAVFAEPLSCCLNALEQANLRSGESIAIWGAGPAGTLLARAATALGAKPSVIEPDERRRTMINGVQSLDNELFDVAIPAVGSPEVYSRAIKLLKPRGRLVAFSGLPHDRCEQSIDMNALHYMEQTVVGAYGCSYRHSVQAVELLAAGTVQVDDMISHRLPLGQLGEALDLVRNRKGMKILLYPERKN